MTTDELNAIVQAVMTELEKAGVDFDFKAEVPQADDLVYVIRGTADRYMGITVKWQNLLDIIVQKATEAKNEAVSAKDIALQTLTTIQGIESNVSLMKSSVETTKGEVETLKSDVTAMKSSVETSEANVTQMKSEVSEMKASVEGTKTEVENIKEETAGLLDAKVDYTDLLTNEQIMATTPLFDLDKTAPKASAFKSYAKVYSTVIADSYAKKGISLIRTGNVVQCSHYGDTASAIPKGSFDLGTIPNGYKPTIELGTLILPNGNNIIVVANSFGVFYGYNYKGSEYNGSFRFSMTWITNDPFPTT